MTHVEPAHLVELALGNASDGDPAALRHVAVCARCRDELAWMRRVVTAARQLDASDLPVVPPEHVWERLSRELSTADRPARPHSPDPHSPDPRSPDPRSPAPHSAGPRVPGHRAGTGRARATCRTSTRPGWPGLLRRPGPAAVATAVAALVAVAVVLAVVPRYARRRAPGAAAAGRLTRARGGRGGRATGPRFAGLLRAGCGPGRPPVPRPASPWWRRGC